MFLPLPDRVKLLFVLLIIQASVCSAQSPFEDLIQSKRNAVIDVSTAFSQQLSPREWCGAAEKCDQGPCFTSGCSGNSFGDDFKCSSRVILEEQPQICSDSPHPNDALLNFEKPFLWISSDATSNEGDGSNITIRDPAVRRDVCASKKLGPNLKTAYFEHNLTDWIYTGTALGVMTIFPGVPRKRDRGYSSCTYNPIIRPWYIQAASGPKDIVFLFDATSLLQNKKKLLEAFRVTLGTLDRNDYVAIVRFGKSSAETVDGSTALQSATTATVEKLAEELNSLPLDGPPNVTLAFHKAFDIHENTSASTQCSASKLIVLLSGQQDICLAECRGQKSCNCVQSLREYIDSRQVAFGESPISIITFTEDNSNDFFSSNAAERMARTIVCDKKNMGIWRRVTDSDTGGTAMSTYTQITAASIFEENPEIVFSDTYLDAGGLGEIFTLSRAVYSVSEKRLLSVVGADITVREVISTVGNEVKARNLIKDEALKARRCSKVTVRRSCELQTIRSQPSSAMCADVLPPSRCYQRGKKVYMPFNETGTWNEAKLACAELADVSASLIKIESEQDNRFVAGFMSADGTWLGLRAESGQELMWEDGTKPEYETFAYKAFDIDVNTVSTQVQNDFAVPSCATADRRGVRENWNIEPCSAKREFACEMTAGPKVTELCEGEVFSYGPSSQPVNDVNCVTLASSVRNCTEDDDSRIQKVNPVCPESNSDFTTKDRFCCGGLSDRDLTLQHGETEEISNEFDWWWVLVGFGLIVLTFIILCTCNSIFRFSVRKAKKTEEEKRKETERKKREAELKEREVETKRNAQIVGEMVKNVEKLVNELKEDTVALGRESGQGSGEGSPPPVGFTSVGSPRTPGLRQIASAPPLTPDVGQTWQDTLPPNRSDSSVYRLNESYGGYSPYS